MAFTPHQSREIAGTVVRLFDAEVCAAADAPRAQLDELFPDELNHICFAVKKRQAEFATSRACARRLLAQLGIDACSLAPHSGRAPRWPAGIVGSITHTKDVCIVVMARTSELSTIGIDAESEAPLKPELERLVCTDREMDWLRTLPSSDRGTFGKLIFSAKEAFYKCQYMKTETFMDFRDLELDMDIAAGTFRPRVLKALGPVRFELQHARGRWAWCHGLVLTGVSLAPTRTR